MSWATAAALDSELRLDRLRGARSSSCSMAEGRREDAEPERLMVLPEGWVCGTASPDIVAEF